MRLPSNSILIIQSISLFIFHTTWCRERVHAHTHYRGSYTRSDECCFCLRSTLPPTPQPTSRDRKPASTTGSNVTPAHCWRRTGRPARRRLRSSDARGGRRATRRRSGPCRSSRCPLWRPRCSAGPGRRLGRRRKRPPRLVRPPELRSV